MRKSRTQRRQGLLFYLVLGLLLNIVVAYSCGWRAGALGFSMADGAYGNWTHFVEFDDGWSTEGTTLGVTGWYTSFYTSDPPDLYNTDDSVSDKSGTHRTTNNFGNRIGWPLRCIGYSHTWLEVMILRPKAESKNIGRVISTTDTDMTPMPHWYSKGIKTKLNNSVLTRIPVQIRPLQFAANTLFYGVGAFAIRLLIVRIKHSRRKRSGLCVACGYAIEDLNVCPECGADHAAC